MTPQIAYITKTELYLKVKKPLLERQRRARINKCLDIMKELVAQVQNDDAILRMDKAEMLEAVLTFIKSPPIKMMMTTLMPGDSYRHGFMNAVNEVSRVMASTPGMNVNVGKAVMTHLGSEFNRLLHIPAKQPEVHRNEQGRIPTNSTSMHASTRTMVTAATATTATPAATAEETTVHPGFYLKKTTTIWRPW